MSRFRVPGNHIVHEVIDDEVIVIDFSVGTYYSLLGSAADTWCALTQGASVSAVVDFLRSRYTAEGADVGAALAPFVETLAHEGLLVEDEGAPDGWVAPEAPPTRGQFNPPTIERFADLQDLILIDPVHDVSAAKGWPHRAE